jgi:hypothetical protein
MASTQPATADLSISLLIVLSSMGKAKPKAEIDHGEGFIRGA